MRQKLSIASMLLVAVLILGGCSADTNEVIKVTDKAKVENWLGKVRDIAFDPDPNQEERDG
jgi:PBP1b-binding outer membrane lipoprotein LpoB